MRRFLLAILLSSSSFAAAASELTDAVWQVASRYCVPFVEAGDHAAALAALEGVDAEMATTPDGWGLIGSGQLQDETLPGLDHAILSFNRAQETDGYNASCQMTLIAEDEDALKDLQSSVEAGAAPESTPAGNAPDDKPVSVPGRYSASVRTRHGQVERHTGQRRSLSSPDVQQGHALIGAGKDDAVVPGPDADPRGTRDDSLPVN